MAGTARAPLAGAPLQIRLLGDLEVSRDGETLSLPPSKKTRALLAYLVMNPRPFRREFLCELLWEVPDDPRGSLRWSLSKLRGLVDCGARKRIVADRQNVRLDSTDIATDVQALHRLAGSDPARLPVEELQVAVENFRDQFLEGLDLTNFYGFYAWCVAEREKAARSRGALLEALVNRLEHEPERALHYARALVINAPYDESARSRLIRMLVAQGRPEEAEQQYDLGLRMLRETGVESSGALFQAWRGAPGGARNRPRGPARTAQRFPTPGLIGREAETRRLLGLFNRCQSEGRARMVLVSGVPGIGKSRLLDTAVEVARRENVRVIAARAVASESRRPFGLWISALANAGTGPGGMDLAEAAWENRERLFDALGDFVAGETARAPAVLVLDDLQWCDESSAAALEVVAGASRDRPLLIVLAGRQGELQDNSPLQRTLRALRALGLEELRLEPLDEAAVRTLVEEQGVEDGLDLARQCGGNPLLAIELARAVASGDDGATLRELVRARLAALDLQVVDVIRWAVVLGQRIEIDRLTGLTGLSVEDVGAALEQGVNHALLVPVEYGFRFSHDLVASSIYHDISPTRLRVMHRRVAELLESNIALDLGFAADLAHHALHSGDAALAARSLVAAGRLCLRFFANQDALAMAERGLSLASRLGEPDRVCLTLDFHDIKLTAARLPDWDAAAQLYIQLAEKALDHGAVNHARLGYYMASYLRWCHGEWRDAKRETLQAERIARGGSEEDHLLGLAETAKCLVMLEQDLPQANAMLLEASAIAERRNLRMQVIPLVGGLLHYHDDGLAEAEEKLLLARSLAKSAGDRINEFLALEYLAMIAFERRDHDRATTLSGDLVELGDKLRAGSEAPFARAVAALCRYALEDLDEGLESALADLRAADAKHRLACVLTRAAQLDLERQRFEAASRRAAEALLCAQALERGTETLLARLILADAEAALGNGAASEEHLTVVSGLVETPVARWARNRAIALLEADG